MKKDVSRFCIKFNMQDPKHMEVMNLLNQQGRGKAQYIADAIQYYNHETTSREEILLEKMEQIMRRVMEEHLSDRPARPRGIPRTLPKAENISLPERDEVDVQQREAVQDIMSSFRD